MSGYHFYSKSNNAIDAENNERYPLTKAANIFAKKMNCTVSKAKAFLKSQGTSEWHHTSKFYNQTQYYDVSDYEIEQNLQEEFDKFEYKPEEKKKKNIILIVGIGTKQMKSGF